MQTKSLPKVFIAVFGFFLFANILQAQVTETEPNNTPAQANILPLNTMDSGAISPAGDIDYWKVTTTADGQLNLYLTSGNGQNLNINLLDSNGTTVINYNIFIGDSSTLSTDGLAAGTYYIQVFGSYPTVFTPYTLRNSVVPVVQANDNEPDSNRATALTLPLNSTTTGHVGYYYNNRRDTTDWYKVTTTAGGQLNLYLTSDNGQDLNINLLDNNGTTVINYTIFVGGSSTLSTDGLAAGTYYVQVNGSYPNGFTPYTLTNSLFTYSYAADTAAEPNNQPYLAKTLPPNITTTGQVNFYYNLVRDSTDWWKINYTDTSGNLNLTFNLLPHIIDGSYSDTWFQVYKDTAAAPIYSNSNSSPSSTIKLTGLTQGYYYIRIFEFYNGNKQYEAYSITDSFTTLPVTFINFNGALRDDNAYLNWSTATEINNKGFELQKSMDGRTFSDIGFVSGHGNSANVNNYNYTDVKVLSGSNYYRLKQIDLDGNFIYSSIIKLNHSKFGWSILGNPVNNNSWMQLQLDKASNVSVQIISINGDIIKTINKGNISAGTYSIPLNLSNASSGTYVVRLIINNKTYSQMIIK